MPEHSRCEDLGALRAHAIERRRSFTLDIEIHPATGGARRVRLITAPVREGGKGVKLHGLKLAV